MVMRAPGLDPASLLVIWGVELRHGFDPVHCLVLLAPIERSHLKGNAPADRAQTRVGDYETQFTQTTSPPPLAHHPHSFSRRRHLDLPPLAAKRNALLLEDKVRSSPVELQAVAALTCRRSRYQA
jgi:hypothetical protein